MVRNNTMACDYCNLVVFPNSHFISELKFGANSIDGESAYLHFHDRHKDDCYEKRRKNAPNPFSPVRYSPT